MSRAFKYKSKAPRLAPGPCFEGFRISTCRISEPILHLGRNCRGRKPWKRSETMSKDRRKRGGQACRKADYWKFLEGSPWHAFFPPEVDIWMPFPTLPMGPSSRTRRPEILCSSQY